ncbi:DUF2283 domain-containing protein [Candidatus Parcubacteria bacterium]|nr:MAG: DUF2283 domain-containing protein [Candidatus Parcubacteria bacterium]
MIYDPGANILYLELSNGAISYGKELGGKFVVYFSRLGKPIALEILGASNFIGKINKIKKITELDLKQNFNSEPSPFS